MAQQDFENFKQQIKDWMDSHPEEFGFFDREGEIGVNIFLSYS